MNANEIAVGEYFIATMWRDDFDAAKDKRHVPGEQIRVTCRSAHDLSDMLPFYANLPHDNSHQISTSLALWVCGQREKRSKYVRLHDWSSRCVDTPYARFCRAKRALEHVSQHDDMNVTKQVIIDDLLAQFEPVAQKILTF